MFYVRRLLLIASFISCILVTISKSTASKSSSIISNDDSKVEISSRIKRSPYLYPYRKDYHQYFVDEEKRDVDENAFDRKRRIAYYYPQRSYNFVAFDDSDEDQKRKKRNLLYYPQQGSHYPMYGIDDDYQDEMDRRRRSILSYPSYGNSPFMQIEDDSDEDNEGEVFKRRRRVVPYYFPRFGGSGSYNRFLKRFAYFDDQDSDKKRKRSTDNQEEDDENRKKRSQKRSGSKRSLLLDDLANDDITSFGYDKRA